MKTAFRVQLIATALLAVFACSNPLGLLAASKYAVISQAGESLPSVFDGVKPSPFALFERSSRHESTRMPWKGITSNHLPGLMPVHIIGGGSCPSTEACSGNFTVIIGSGGCADPNLPAGAQL
jgi:hypothetical protein